MQTKTLDTQNEEVEGLDASGGSWGDYPLDELLIRQETRTVQGVLRRIDQGYYVMNPDFQRDFIWSEDKQSKLIESVLMRIPLPVFYMAEDAAGRMIVVDGLQRLSTFQRFLKDELRLQLRERQDLDGKRFEDLAPKLQNRIEDCNLIFYIIDSRSPERARLDIFERVNGGMALTRQQMRNCLYMGQATRFLKEEAQTQIFAKATGGSLSPKTMRDREFVNRFCAFRLVDLDAYHGDMDDFLRRCLEKMNDMEREALLQLSAEFRMGLTNNSMLFDRHAFRKHSRGQDQRNALNAALWDAMSTGLSFYPEDRVEACSESIRKAFYKLLDDNNFNSAISGSTNDPRKVKTRFQMSREMFKEILGARTD